LRCGSSTPECTIINPSQNTIPQIYNDTPNGRKSKKSDSNLAKDDRDGGTTDTPGDDHIITGGFEQANVLTLSPSSDHALAYSVAESGVSGDKEYSFIK
jgi:hypothetical protein